MIKYIESKVEYGEGHGDPFNHFKNIYYDRYFIGRTYVNSDLFTYNETTEVYVPQFLTKEQLEPYGVVYEPDRGCNDRFLSFKNDEEGAIKALFKLLNDFKIELDGEYIKEEGEYLI